MQQSDVLIKNISKWWVMNIDKIKRFASKKKIFQYVVNILFLAYGGITALICLCMRIFPVQKDKIVCCNMKGKRYGDNPKYIADYLLKNNISYDIVWILQNDVNEDLPNGVRKVSNGLFSMLYELVTAGVWIDSNTKPFGILKRKNQLYIQTWHGSYGLKKVYGDIPDKISFIDRTIMRYNSAIADLYVSNSKQTSEIYKRAFWYKGRILECGSPRNDIFYEDAVSYIEKVQQYFNTVGKKMALYAPTYRADFGTDAFQLNYDLIRSSLKERFGGEWIILVRLHPQNIIDADNFLKYDENVVNATHYSIMQELLVACDVLITDYSSCMFDFATRKKICFLYAPDIDKYKDERDVYFDLDKLPFPAAQNNNELCAAIQNFNQNEYNLALDRLFEQVGLCECGYASRQVAEYIENWREGKVSR